MRITESSYSIAELKEMLGRRELRVNHSYQRGSRIWPPGPRTYFVDTILKGFPFPKIYFYEYLDRSDRSLKKDIVDGQQRISTIIDFIGDKFSLTGVCEEYSGMMFSELPDDVQNDFLMYTVFVDVIRNADESEILEMFRRMNAYTLPLNEAEKRHSTFQGEFKWFINSLSTEFDNFFFHFGVFNERQIVRMADAELISDIIFGIENGLVTTTASKLRAIYKEYDKDFPEPTKHTYNTRLHEIIEAITASFSTTKKTFLMKPYVLHSLSLALYHNKYGIDSIRDGLGLEPLGEFFGDREVAQHGLEALARSHEAKEEDGEFGEYVWSCLAGTNTEKRREPRFRFLLSALRGELLR